MTPENQNPTGIDLQITSQALLPVSYWVSGAPPLQVSPHDSAMCYNCHLSLGCTLNTTCFTQEGCSKTFAPQKKILYENLDNIVTCIYEQSLQIPHRKCVMGVDMTFHNRTWTYTICSAKKRENRNLSIQREIIKHCKNPPNSNIHQKHLLR